MDDQQPEPKALTAEAAAAYLGGAPITADTMLSLARRKKIGYLKVGRATTFPVSALDAYIANNTIAPVENPWGLTDTAMRNIRGARLTPQSAKKPAA